MQQRIDTKTSHHRTGLALFEVFRAVHASVLSWRDVHAQCVAVVHHDAIATHVDPAVVGIAGDDHVAGADISTTVPFVPKGNRKLEEIDIVALIDVFENRPA